MTLGQSPRAGQLPRRNERWENLQKTQHARTQSEMVDAIMLERNKGRRGLKVQELGNQTRLGPEGQELPDNSPASKLLSMTYEEMQGFFNSILKSYRVIQRLEVYKDDALLDDEVFETKITAENLTLSPNVYKSRVHLSDKLALELSKENVAGIDINAEGDLWTYYWKSSNKPQLDENLKSGRGKKEKKKDQETAKVEKKSVHPVIKIHYLLD